MTIDPAQRRPRGLAAVVLSGGTGARLGGMDKATIEVDGISLLERALAATGDLDEVVVVGKQVPTSRPVTWTREDPAGGGPAAGLLAGVDALASTPELLVVLAVDMPHVTRATIARLVAAVSTTAGADGAVLVDAGGRQQTLAAAYRYDAVVAARPADRADEHGLAIRRLLAPLRLIEVDTVDDEARDVDTWEDLRDLT